MTEEQQFKTKALSQGMEALKAEYRNRMDRETDSYHQAVFQLLLNVDETWRAKNEKSWFDTALDNIGGHEVVKKWEDMTSAEKHRHTAVGMAKSQKPVEPWRPETW